MKTYFSMMVIAMSLTNFAHAECVAAYKDQLKTIEGRMNPPRTTVISNAVGEGVLIGTLATIGTVTPAAVLALPAAAIGAGAYFGILEGQKITLRNGMHVISEAHKGSGPQLDKFIKLVNRKTHHRYAQDDIINFVVNADFDNKFCEQNPRTDKVSLMTFRKMVRFTSRGLADE